MDNFYAKDLDEAYLALNKLYLLATEDGDKLKTDLKGIITNLQGHWKGNDATIHINNLMDICTGLNTLINTIKLVAHDVSVPIVKAQSIRNMNGGGGNVDGMIPFNEEEIMSFGKLDNTVEYYVDPVGAPADYNELVEVCNMFTGFCNKFQDFKGKLLEEWLSGKDRDKAVSDFEEFESNVTTYTAKLNEAKDRLGTATSNLKEL